jgi:hypothetical protein
MLYDASGREINKPTLESATNDYVTKNFMKEFDRINEVMDCMRSRILDASGKHYPGSGTVSLAGEMRIPFRIR